LSAVTLYHLASSSLLAGAAVSLLPIPARRPVALVAAAVASLTLAPAMSGLIGAPSFTLTQMALLQIFAPAKIPKDRAAALVLVIVAAIFYPLALGLSAFDPFDIGYHPLPLLIATAVLGLGLAARRKAGLMAILGFDLIAYACGIFDNLWSALFDPILVMLAIVVLVRAAILRYSGRTEPKPC
jgi:hypothetical protein